MLLQSFINSHLLTEGRSIDFDLACKWYLQVNAVHKTCKGRTLYFTSFLLAHGFLSKARTMNNCWVENGYY